MVPVALEKLDNLNYLGHSYLFQQRENHIFAKLQFLPFLVSFLGTPALS
jgi:hypothetical protein